MLTIAFDTFVLANGLPVILHVDRSSPLVAVDVWYHVGSKDESPGRTGFAHLFEHLMFMGSRNAPYPAFDTIMESWGGHNNGTTSNDRTNYYEIGPRNLLETFLWLEADRLATLPDVITERGAGAAAARWCRTNAASRTRTAPTAAASWRSRRRCTRPTIRTTGRRSDRTRIWRPRPSADVRAFFERFYRPSNASLVIARRLRSRRGARAWSKSISPGSRGCRRRARSPRPAEPRLGATSTIALTDRVQLPRLRLGWHSPALFAPGDADLDMAAHVLGGGKSSRLYESLVFEKRIAQDVFAYQGSQICGSMFQVGATAKPGHDLDGARTPPSTPRSTRWPPTVRPTRSWRARATPTWPTSTRASTTCRRAPICSTTTSTCSAIPDGVARDVARYEQATTASVRDAFARVAAAHAPGPAHRCPSRRLAAVTA